MRWPGPYCYKNEVWNSSGVDRLNVVGIGIDIVDMDRFRNKIGQRTFMKFMTEGEIEYCESKNDKVQHYAGRFAAKEAVLKSIGAEGWDMNDVEIGTSENGAPLASVKGRSNMLMSEKGIGSVLISISHTDRCAVAVAIALSAGGSG
jgi:holo-[acyl-carrier protein] synthase